MVRTMLFTVLVTVPALGFFAFLLYLLVRALWKYIHSGETRKEKREVCQTLGEPSGIIVPGAK